MQVMLRIANGKSNVRQVHLHSDTTIGRSPDCQLKVASNQISRRHCQIVIREPLVAIKDLGSANGTFVNGRQIPPEVEMPLTPGTRVALGPLQFTVEYELPGMAAVAPGAGKNASKIVESTDSPTYPADSQESQTTIELTESPLSPHLETVPVGNQFTSPFELRSDPGATLPVNLNATVVAEPALQPQIHQPPASMGQPPPGGVHPGFAPPQLQPVPVPWPQQPGPIPGQNSMPGPTPFPGQHQFPGQPQFPGAMPYPGQGFPQPWEVPADGGANWHFQPGMPPGSMAPNGLQMPPGVSLPVPQPASPTLPVLNGPTAPVVGQPVIPPAWPQPTSPGNSFEPPQAPSILEEEEKSFNFGIYASSGSGIIVESSQPIAVEPGTEASSKTPEKSEKKGFLQRFGWGKKKPTPETASPSSSVAPVSAAPVTPVPVVQPNSTPFAEPTFELPQETESEEEEEEHASAPPQDDESLNSFFNQFK